MRPVNYPVGSNKWKRKYRLKYARSLGTHTPEEWLQLKTDTGGRCVRCGRSDLSIEKDHIVPIFAAGDDSIANLQPLCFQCNGAKGYETINWLRFRELFGWELLVSNGGKKQIVIVDRKHVT